MYDVDVNGTHNVLEAAARGRRRQVLVTTSATAYGAFPDNPVPLTEDDPVRGVAGFTYARDKTESDRLCQLWAAQHPDRVMTIVRPVHRVRPERRQLPRAALDQAAVRRRRRARSTSDIQFVHEDDVVEAITGLLLGRHGGAFNVAGDGLMTKPRVRRADRRPDPQDAAARSTAALARAMWALRAVGGAARADRVRALPVDRSRTRSSSGRLGWTPALHEPRDVRDHDAGAREAAAGGDAPGTEFPAATLAA